MSCVLNDEQSGLIAAAAAAAPSIHNSRPWQVITNGQVVLVGAAPDRALGVSDPTGRALYISCGAALENVRLALRGLACEPAVRLLPHPDYPFDILAEVIVAPAEPAGPADRTLLDAIPRRHTDRRPYTGRPVPARMRDLLKRAAEHEAATLRWLDRTEVQTVLRLTDEAGQELAASRRHQAELGHWIDGGDSRPGIASDARPLRARLRPSPVRDTDFLATAAAGRPVADYEAAPQLAVLTTPADEPADWLRAGQALQRVLLTATACGVSASFLFQSIERDDMRDDGISIWPWAENPQMVIRFGYAARPVPAPRPEAAVR